MTRITSPSRGADPTFIESMTMRSPGRAAFGFAPDVEARFVELEDLAPVPVFFFVVDSLGDINVSSRSTPSTLHVAFHHVNPGFGRHTVELLDEEKGTSVIRTRGVRHIHILVRDLERSLRFYRDVFGVEELFREDELVFVTTPGSNDLITLHESDSDDVGPGAGVRPLRLPRGGRA
jgi:glyoxalase/bleomycin resistance protein/dioxygenase superfamily protein